MRKRKQLGSQVRNKEKYINKALKSSVAKIASIRSSKLIHQTNQSRHSNHHRNTAQHHSLHHHSHGFTDGSSRRCDPSRPPVEVSLSMRRLHLSPTLHLPRTGTVIIARFVEATTPQITKNLNHTLFTAVTYFTHLARSRK